MKTTTLMLPLLILFFVSCSSEMEIVSTDVPPAVNDAFQAKYPGAEDVKWEIEKEDDHLIYEVEFEIDDINKEASFRADGTQIDD